MKQFFMSFAVIVSMYCMTSQAEAATKPEPIKENALLSIQNIM